jgi:T4 beta protein
MLKLGPFRHTDFLAVLKWKQGERTALATFRAGPGRLHVLFDMPPAGDFDHEKQRPLTPTEHIKMFGRRLQDAWGNRVAFVDAGCVDDDLHKEGLTRHPLTELLERARLAGALACPAVTLSHSDEYRRAVHRFVERNPEFPICVRVESSDLDRPTFQTDLKGMLRELQCEPSRCFLVLDFKTLSIPMDDFLDEFVEMLADRIAELPFVHNWMGFAVALSSFPASIKLKPGDVKEYPRSDLSLYEKLISNPKALLRTPMYGDYALDTSPVQKPQRRTPSAHLRYSTATSYAVAKGTTVKKPYGYEAIYPVADLLTARPYFAGPTYSAGDAYISGLQQRTASKGNAAKWRWASTDHHLTVNEDAIAAMYGIAKVAPAVTPEPTQADMFAREDSPSTAPDPQFEDLGVVRSSSDGEK